MIKKYTFLLAFLFTTTLLWAQQANVSPKREFRGVWVATVENIDWPSKPTSKTNAVQQQQELVQLLDAHQKTGINAIMLQVRPATDAFYGKGREEWSRFLTGTQGQAPTPYYDPLAFAITEAHKRGMELHAWFNPYRATTDLVDNHVSPTHITRTHPEWFFTYGSKKYFNPGLPEVRAYIVQVILDAVRNYDLDGVHFDDYFYPYPEKSALPDSAAYRQYGSRFASIDDWRRHNVDTLIYTLSDSIHAAKSYVKFGVSPFGIWRNKAQDPAGSESNGLSGYSALYADARKWMQQGWLDYVNPQLYFPFHYPAAPYEKLLDWWSVNAGGRHLYIGQGVYRAMEDREGWRDRQQLPNQVRYLRQNDRVHGSVYFSSKSLTDNLAGFRDSLQQDFYRYPALQPVMPWLGKQEVAPPVNLREHKFLFFSSGKKTKLRWQMPAGSPVYGYVVYRFQDEEPFDLSRPEKIVKITFDQTQTAFDDTGLKPGHTYHYVVTALDRLKNESTASAAFKKKIR
ncbi:glycoside hydrolase family 10 protein [Pontibacter liquoris]|uniref:glycoside hydrolase family 10 protein n=1 Tax=Pontibacter liquoris TaxID=2905677 RepID=UPI001FA6F587|nr:family 10 glycosylhydrolase [Pontibacter liquoris]